MTRPGGTTNKKAHVKGVCLGCLKTMSIRKDGTIIEHKGDRKARVGPFARRRCSGVGTPALSIPT